MLADIDAMLELPISDEHIAQKIAVADAFTCTLDDDRSHRVQSGTNAWETAVEDDLGPFRCVIVFNFFVLLFGAFFVYGHMKITIFRIINYSRFAGAACALG